MHRSVGKVVVLTVSTTPPADWFMRPEMFKSKWNLAFLFLRAVCGEKLIKKLLPDGLNVLLRISAVSDVGASGWRSQDHRWLGRWGYANSACLCVENCFQKESGRRGGGGGGGVVPEIKSEHLFCVCCSLPKHSNFLWIWNSFPGSDPTCCTLPGKDSFFLLVPVYTQVNTLSQAEAHETFLSSSSSGSVSHRYTAFVPRSEKPSWTLCSWITSSQRSS